MPARPQIGKVQRAAIGALHHHHRVAEFQADPVAQLCHLQLRHAAQPRQQGQIQHILTRGEVLDLHPAGYHLRQEDIGAIATPQRAARNLRPQHIIARTSCDRGLPCSGGDHLPQIRQIEGKTADTARRPRSRKDLQRVARHQGFQRRHILQPQAAVVGQAGQMQQLPRRQHPQQADAVIAARCQHQHGAIRQCHHLQRRQPAKPGGGGVVQLIGQRQRTIARHRHQAERAAAARPQQGPGPAMRLKACDRADAAYRQAILDAETARCGQRARTRINPVAAQPLKGAAFGQKQ